MKRLFVAAAALALGGALATTVRVPGTTSSAGLAALKREQMLEKCGVWRWEVKTLSDPAAKDGQVNFSPK